MLKIITILFDEADAPEIDEWWAQMPDIEVYQAVGLIEDTSVNFLACIFLEFISYFARVRVANATIIKTP